MCEWNKLKDPCTVAALDLLCTPFLAVLHLKWSDILLNQYYSHMVSRSKFPSDEIIIQL
jgi:hypothetical protein